MIPEQKAILRAWLIGIWRYAIPALICASTACSSTRTTLTDRQKTAIADSAPSVESMIRSADAAWAEAIASKSVDQTLAVYAPEAVTAGSAMFPARGLADFRAAWPRLFAEPDFALTWKTEHIVVTESGSLAYSSGTWNNGKQHGPFLAVWQKQTDGQWKVLIDAAWIVP